MWFGIAADCLSLEVLFGVLLGRSMASGGQKLDP